MSETIIVTAEMRDDVGKGASRRLRQTGKVPAVIYGGSRDPVSLVLQQDELRHASDNEAFYASILEIRVGDDLTQQAVVRDMQRHPFKPMIMHVDFMRVSAEEMLRISVPIHFVGEEHSPAGKASGIVIQHQMTEVEISALPKDLPEFIPVDLSEMDAGDVVMLSDIQLPEGVSIPALAVAGEQQDATVANAVHVKADQGTGAAAAAEAEAALADELGEIPEEEGLEEAEGEEGEEGAEGDERDS
jgi:large subunit ribosomal protein L25